MSRSARLAVIVVSYNVCGLLRSCLRSIAASAGRAAGKLEVATVVVDNASTDGSAAMVAAEFPEVHLIASQENLGFTGANNHALRWLGFPDPERDRPRPDYVLLLNPDTEILDDALGQMVGFLERRADVAVCGAGLRYGDGAFQHSAFRFPGVAQVFLDLFAPTGLRGAHRLLDSRLNGRYPAALWRQGEPFAVDFVLGAAMMVRGHAIAAVGGLDEGYWMYCEEMDWCRRFWRSGRPVYALPSAQIIHHEAQSSRQRRWLAQERLWRSRFRFYAKYRDAYSPVILAWIRLLVHAGMWRQKRQATKRFAAGEIDGVELAQALATCTAISKLTMKAT